MASEKQMKYIQEYKKEKLHRVPLELPHDKYAEVLAAAQAAGESVNGYIKKAIQMRMDQGGY